MKYAKLFFTAALIAGAALTTGCKEDREPADEPSDVQGLFVNEVCSGGTDWIEFHNATDTDINLSGYHVQDNKGTDEEYTFPEGSSIGPKSFLVIEEGTFEFGISGDGDSITLLDEKYAKIDEVTIPAMEDGFTYSRIEDGGSSWEIVEGGTKGRSNSGTPDDNPDDNPDEPVNPGESESPILVNEVQGATIDGEQTDFIELYNPSSSSVDISGYRLQDDKGAEEEYVIPEGTTIEAGQIMVFYKDETFTFGLGGDGDVVTVLDAEGKIVDTIEYPAMEDGSSYARIPDGSDNWQVVTEPTPGESNGQGGGSEDPETPSGHAAIRLNELNGNDKFIELYNISDEDVDITGVYFTKDDEDTFTAPEGTVIPAKGFLTVWSEKADGDHELIFDFGLSADKSVKIELFAPDGKALDVFKNLSTALGETWGEDDGKYDSKDLGSFARNTDGTGDWYIMVPTEGKTNAGSEVLSEKIEW